MYLLINNSVKINVFINSEADKFEINNKRYNFDLLQQNILIVVQITHKKIS